MCMCVCASVCVRVCTHGRGLVDYVTDHGEHLCVCVYVWVYVCVHACMHVCMCVELCCAAAVCMERLCFGRGWYAWARPRRHVTDHGEDLCVCVYMRVCV